MDDRSKTTMTHDDSLPLVQASLVEDNSEPFTQIIQTDFVVIDAYFENNGENLDLSESYNSTLSTTTSVPENFDPSHSNRFDSHPQDFLHFIEEDFDSNHFHHSKKDQSKTFGAWAAGIVLGFIMGAGPSLSMAFGIGAAYYSQQEEGVAGDLARAMGDVALLSHARFVQVNEKHNLVETLANGTVAVTRSCLSFVRKYIDGFFLMVDETNQHSTRQRSTQNTTTT